MHSSSKAILVAGIALRHRFVDDAIENQPLLSGPVILASIGAQETGLKTDLLTALPGDLTSTDRLLLNRIDPGLFHVRHLTEPAMQLVTPRHLSNSAAYDIVGTPTIWRAPLRLTRDCYRAVVLSNGDPAWYCSWIHSIGIECPIILDLHGMWFGYRETEIQNCLSRATLVTLTRAEFSSLPRALVARAALGKHGGAALILKDGANGCIARAFGGEVELPAPQVKGEALHDIGAGDLLIGLLAGHLATISKAWTLTDIVQAYHASLSRISELLRSERPDDFVRSFVIDRDRYNLQ